MSAPTDHQHRPAESDPLGPCVICGADPLADFVAGRNHRRSPETPTTLDTGIRLVVKIDNSRTPEQQGEECRRAYEEAAMSPRRITAEPPGWEGTRALHERHVASWRSDRCPVCGGLNPGDSSHVRCM